MNDIYKINSLQEFKSVHLQINDLQENFRELLIRLDSFLRPLDELRTEYCALSGITSRHEGWIHQLAEKTETKLLND